MAIPDLNDEGFLPEGVHECSLDELQHRFGESDRLGHRSGLFAKRVDYLRELRSTELVIGLVVDGRFVTDKAEARRIVAKEFSRCCHDDQ